MTTWTRTIAIGIGFALAMAGCGARQVPVASGTSTLPAEDSAAVAESAPPAQPPAATQEAMDGARLEAIFDRRREGNAVMRIALKEYLDSVPHYAFRGAAFAALGDIELDDYRGQTDRLVLAETYYKSALWGDGRHTIHATYKLARLYVIRGDYSSAIAAYQRTCELESLDRRLADAARHELPAVFAIEHTPSEAYALFAKISRDDKLFLAMLGRLAAAYEALGKYAECRSVYDELRRRDPRHTCWWTVHYRHATPAATPATFEADLAKCPDDW